MKENELTFPRGKLLMTKIIDTTGVDDDWTREQRGITWETPILLGISRFY